MHLLTLLQNTNDSQRRTSKWWLDIDLNETNFWCINYNQCIENKVKKMRMKVIKYACIKLEEKATKRVKKNTILSVL